jgi:hypothetical protein
LNLSIYGKQWKDQEKEKEKLEGTSQQKNPTQIGVFISGAIKQYHKKNQGNQDVKSIGG